MEDPETGVKADLGLARGRKAVVVALVGVPALLASARCAVAHPQVFETAKLVVPRTVDDIVFQEFLGDAVSATEDSAWVGEPVDKVVIGGEGSVFGFQRTKDGWILANELTAFDAHKAQVRTQSRLLRRLGRCGFPRGRLEWSRDGVGLFPGEGFWSMDRDAKGSPSIHSRRP